MGQGVYRFRTEGVVEEVVRSWFSVWGENGIFLEAVGYHAKKLFENRLAQPAEEQAIRLYQYLRSCRGYGCSHVDRLLGL